MSEYSEKTRKEAHDMLDVLLDCGFSVVVAGRKSAGGAVWHIVGNTRVVKGLLGMLYKRSLNDTL